MKENNEVAKNSLRIYVNFFGISFRKFLIIFHLLLRNLLCETFLLELGLWLYLLLLAYMLSIVEAASNVPCIHDWFGSYPHP